MFIGLGRGPPGRGPPGRGPSAPARPGARPGTGREAPGIPGLPYPPAGAPGLPGWPPPAGPGAGLPGGACGVAPMPVGVELNGLLPGRGPLGPLGPGCGPPRGGAGVGLVVPPGRAASVPGCCPPDGGRCSVRPPSRCWADGPAPPGTGAAGTGRRGGAAPSCPPRPPACPGPSRRGAPSGAAGPAGAAGAGGSGRRAPGAGGAGRGAAGAWPSAGPPAPRSPGCPLPVNGVAAAGACCPAAPSACGGAVAPRSCGPPAWGTAGAAGPACPQLPAGWRPPACACPAALSAPAASGPNASLSLRTTGASIVEDAERTNSPISWSLTMTALLSTPNSFASSYTRTFATTLLYSARITRTIYPDHHSRSGAGRAPGRRQPAVFIASCSSSAHQLLDLLSARFCVPCSTLPDSPRIRHRRARHPAQRHPAHMLCPYGTGLQIRTDRCSAERPRRAQRALERPPALR